MPLRCVVNYDTFAPGHYPGALACIAPVNFNEVWEVQLNLIKAAPGAELELAFSRCIVIMCCNVVNTYAHKYQSTINKAHTGIHCTENGPNDYPWHSGTL